MGTWAVPTNTEELQESEEYIKVLQKFKKDIYSVFGDDELFDCLDGAIRRIREIQAFVESKFNLEG
jgi:F0F1-type ATP synthase beta subunit